MQRSRKLLLAVLKTKNEQADKGKNEQLDKKWRTNGQIEGTLDFTLWIKKP